MLAGAAPEIQNSPRGDRFEEISEEWPFSLNTLRPRDQLAVLESRIAIFMAHRIDCIEVDGGPWTVDRGPWTVDSGK